LVNVSLKSEITTDAKSGILSRNGIAVDGGISSAAPDLTGKSEKACDLIRVSRSLETDDPLFL
jgi:hypothetical protein